MNEDQPAGLLSHLVELRSRLLRSIAGVGVVFVGLFPFSDQLYRYFAMPLLERMPGGTSMVAIDVASPFLTPFKLSLLASLLIALPWVLYQVWAFVAPGLYPREKRMVFPLTIWSVILFYSGMAFAYFVVFPLAFGFFISVAPEGVAIMTDISRYLDFVITLFIAFGLSFEVPIATYASIKAGLITPDDLARKRPYMIVAAFVVGMTLTPPDVISQILLALPMWALFEIGLLMARFQSFSAGKVVEDAE